MIRKPYGLLAACTGTAAGAATFASALASRSSATAAMSATTSASAAFAGHRANSFILGPLLSRNTALAESATRNYYNDFIENKSVCQTIDRFTSRIKKETEEKK